MLRKLVLCVLIAMAFPIAAQDSEPALAGDLTEADIALFDYDRSAPLDITEVGVEMAGDVTVKDITYLALDGETVEAYLVVPPGDGPFPAVLWVHGYAVNRETYLDEAVDFAASDGVASLVIGAAWTDQNWFATGRAFETDYVDNIAHVIGLRRALDVLEAQPFVDPLRLGFVGREISATFGATMAGVDHRVSAYVLIAPNSNFLNWIIRSGRDNFAEQDYLAQLDSISALRFIPNAAPSALLFQFNQNDRSTPVSDNELLFAAASEPKQTATYNLARPAGREAFKADRQQFLRDALIPLTADE